jgi:hypothetical protein
LELGLAHAGSAGGAYRGDRVIESGYRLERVSRFIREHGHLRECDQRPMRLNGQPLPESYRNTLANWERLSIDPVPLGRWDEILMGVDLMLWEYEYWEEQTYGSVDFRDCANIDSRSTDNQTGVINVTQHRS